jgi:acyl carrier protein
MMKDEIVEVLKRTFELDKIDETISQKNCTQWDSLHHLNMIVELESVFDVTFEPEEIAEMKSFAAIEKMLAQKLS